MNIYVVYSIILQCKLITLVFDFITIKTNHINCDSQIVSFPEHDAYKTDPLVAQLRKAAREEQILIPAKL